MGSGTLEEPRRNRVQTDGRHQSRRSAPERSWSYSITFTSIVLEGLAVLRILVAIPL